MLDALQINGGQTLVGDIRISGAKNAALPLMAACLLSDHPLRLDNIPPTQDIDTMQLLLQQLGATATVIDTNPNYLNIELNARSVDKQDADYELVRKMRASILVLGPLLARFGKAHVSLPGGCVIGQRPVNAHLLGLEALGAAITLEHGYINAHFANGKSLVGADFTFPVVTVTGTENVLMAAVLAKGESVLRNCAIEPEITNLVECLQAMGAKIDGIGSSTLTIQGVDSLRPAQCSIIPDRLEAGSYIIAAAITSGKLRIVGANLEPLLPNFLDKLKESGVNIECTPEFITVSANRRDLKPFVAETAPFPGYATDLQAQAVALMTLIPGTSVMTENIFENRFMHVPELVRMGAQIQQDGHTLHINGVDQLSGASVMASDLRASMSLVLAGLAAEGETIVNRIYHLDRGYVNVVEKLRACNAVISRITV